MTARDLDPATEPIPQQRTGHLLELADRPSPRPDPSRWPTARDLRIAWAMFALAVLGFYLVPIGAAAGWW